MLISALRYFEFRHGLPTPSRHLNNRPLDIDRRLRLGELVGEVGPAAPRQSLEGAVRVLADRFEDHRNGRAYYP